VPFARDLHPEFGYIGSAPKLFRKLGLAAVPEPQDNSSEPADPANVAPTTQSVVPVAKHSQTRSRHVARREGHSYSGRSSYSPRYYSNRQVHQAGGYAGLW
jgi:hypothetical protein